MSSRCAKIYICSAPITSIISVVANGMTGGGIIINDMYECLRLRGRFERVAIYESDCVCVCVCVCVYVYVCVCVPMAAIQAYVFV